MRLAWIVMSALALAACGEDAGIEPATPASDGATTAPGSGSGAPGAGAPADDGGPAAVAPGPDATPDGADDGGATPVPPEGDGAIPGALRHPGVLVSREQLDFVKGKIAAGSEPWKSALAAASKSRFGSLSYAPAPIADVVCGSYSNPDIGCTAEKDDATAAYTHALLWYFTGDAKHAAKAIEILDGWSAVLKEHTDSNAPLQSAWVGSVFPRAAEILRYTGAGWPQASVDRFAKMLRDVYLPEVVNGAPHENGNWELSMTEATMAIGVFLDDPATFAKGVAMWRGRVPAYVYLTSDGPTPVLPPGGAIGPSKLATFWYGQTQLVDGVAQETCRDLGHVQLGLAAMIDAAETARVQGVDLYPEQSKRIVAGLEYHAAFLDGAPVPSWLCGGKLTAVSAAPMWEIALNEYANRLGMALPNVDTLVAKIRPTGTNHHMEWETLTHAETGAVGVK